MMQGGAGAASPSALVVLDVCGTRMVVARDTLCKDPHSMLARMFAAEAFASPARRQEDGSYFLDVDPECFAIALDHLRYGTTAIHPLLAARVRAMADYLGLASLVTACDVSDKAALDKLDRSRRCKCGAILPGWQEKTEIFRHYNELMDYVLKYNIGPTVGWCKSKMDEYDRILAHQCKTNEGCYVAFALGVVAAICTTGLVVYCSSAKP
jgi:hypothetical protein